jgi:hypothetical protein
MGRRVESRREVLEIREGIIEPRLVFLVGGGRLSHLRCPGHNFPRAGQSESERASGARAQGTFGVKGFSVHVAMGFWPALHWIGGVKYDHHQCYTDHWRWEQTVW